MSRLMNSLIRCHNDAMIKFASPTVTDQRFGQALKVPKLWCLKAPVALYEVVVTCVTPEGRPHPHRLEGPHCRDGICVMRGGNIKELPYALSITHTPHVRTHLAGEKFKKVTLKNKSLKNILFGTTSTLLDYYFCPFRFFNPRTEIELPGLKIRQVQKGGVKRALSQKEKMAKPETMFPCLQDDRNPSDPFNMGFSHKHSDVDLSTILLSFDVTILSNCRITKFSPFACSPITNTAPRILDMSERECPVEGGRTTSVRVSREDVQVEFYDKSCSWSAVAVSSEQSKLGFLSKILRAVTTHRSDPEVEVEVPKFPTEVTSRHEVLVRLVPGEGESPGPPVPFYYTPRTSKVEEKVEQVEEDYIALLKKATENIPTQPIKASREVVNENVSQAEDEEAHKRARQKEMVERFFK